jgi:hypothetical protein
MKKPLVYFGLISVSLFAFIALVSCSNLAETKTPTPTLTPAPTSTSTLPSNATPIPPDYWDWHTERSPDNQWQVHLGYQQPISVTSISDQTLVIDDKLPLLGEYNAFESWVPDNSGFVMFDSNFGCEKCPLDRLIVYHIDAELKTLDRYIFDPALPTNYAFWQPITWSPDGTQLAVIVNEKEIFILNRQAKVVREIKPNLGKEEILDQVLWAKFGLAYTTRILTGNQSEQIRLLNLDDVSSAEVILTEGSDGPQILAADPFSPRLMVAHSTRPFNSTLGYLEEIAILNVETHQYEDSVYIYGKWIQYPYYDFASSADQQLVALQLGHDEGNLFIFGWKKRQLTSTDINGTSEKIIGWRQDLQTFIVLRNQQSTSKTEWLESVNPY